jgi:hypothetical protein
MDDTSGNRGTFLLVKPARFVDMGTLLPGHNGRIREMYIITTFEDGVTPDQAIDRPSGDEYA